MHAPRWERFAAICGVLFVVLAITGFVLIDAGAPGADAADAEIVAYFEDDDTELKRELGANFLAGGAFLLLVFLGSLRSALRAAEGERETFTSAAFAGGVAMATLMLVDALLEAGVASADGFFESYDANADTAILLSSMSWWVSGFILLSGGVMVGAASVIALKTGLLPRWIAISGLALSALSFFNETAQALILPLMLVLLWVGLVSMLLFLRSRSTSSPA